MTEFLMENEVKSQRQVKDDRVEYRHKFFLNEIAVKQKATKMTWYDQLKSGKFHIG